MQTQEAIETAADGEIPSPPISNEPATTPSDNQTADLDQLLSSYDEGTREVGSLTNQPSADVDPLDDLIASSFAPAANPQLDAANGRIGQLEGQLNQFQQAIRTAQDRAELGEFEKDIERQLDGIDLPPGYVEAHLLGLASKNPHLVAAFDARNLFAERNIDPRLGAARLSEIQRQLHFEKRPEQINQLRYEAGLINNALAYPKLKLQAERMIVKAAKEWSKNRIDPDATADRAMVAQAVRGSGGKAPAEPPPDLGSMSAADLGRYRKSIGLKSSV